MLTRHRGSGSSDVAALLHAAPAQMSSANEKLAAEVKALTSGAGGGAADSKEVRLAGQ